MTLIWPTSRSKRSLDCGECRGHPGKRERKSNVVIGDVEFYRLTCNYCGHTTLYDKATIQSVPYRGEGDEELPDD